jgi:signal transduction histidine kinase
MTTQTSLPAVGERALSRGADGVRPDERLGAALPAFLRRVASQVDRERLAFVISEELVAALGAVSASVYWAERVEGAPCGALRLAASTNATVTGETIPLEASEPLVARAVRTRTLQLGAALRSDVAAVRSDAWRAGAYGRSPARSGQGGTLALPLVARELVLGVASAELTAPLDRGDGASLDTLDALDALGAVLGALVDRACLVEESRARDEWTKVIVHELRQPLNTMALHAHWLARSPAAPVACAARQAKHCVRRMELLVGDLLDTTLADFAKVSLRVQPTDLVELASNLVAPCDPATPARVQVRALAPLPRVEVDAERIEQVFANLVSNAMKYGRRDAIIRFDLEPRGAEIVVSVTNEGVDIPAGERARLFDRYYRASTGTGDGWGIGLYVCRALVAKHGGRIDVASGGGRTTFRVVLPITQAR